MNKTEEIIAEAIRECLRAAVKLGEMGDEDGRYLLSVLAPGAAHIAAKRLAKIPDADETLDAWLAKLAPDSMVRLQIEGLRRQVQKGLDEKLTSKPACLWHTVGEKPCEGQTCGVCGDGPCARDHQPKTIVG